MHWNICIIDVQNHQGVVTMVKVVPSKWFTVCSSHTFAHAFKLSLKYKRNHP